MMSLLFFLQWLSPTLIGPSLIFLIRVKNPFAINHFTNTRNRAKPIKLRQQSRSMTLITVMVMKLQTLCKLKHFSQTCISNSGFLPASIDLK